THHDFELSLKLEHRATGDGERADVVASVTATVALGNVHRDRRSSTLHLRNQGEPLRSRKLPRQTTRLLNEVHRLVIHVQPVDAIAHGHTLLLPDATGGRGRGARRRGYPLPLTRSAGAPAPVLPTAPEPPAPGRGRRSRAFRRPGGRPAPSGWQRLRGSS